MVPGTSRMRTSISLMLTDSPSATSLRMFAAMLASLGRLAAFRCICRPDAVDRHALRAESLPRLKMRIGFGVSPSPP